MTLNDTFRKISGQLKSPVFEGVSKQILTKKYNHKKEKKMKKRRIIFFHFSWVKPSIMWVQNHALTTHVISILRLRVWNLAWELLIHDFYSSFFFFFFSVLVLSGVQNRPGCWSFYTTYYTYICYLFPVPFCFCSSFLLFIVTANGSKAGVFSLFQIIHSVNTKHVSHRVMLFRVVRPSLWSSRTRYNLDSLPSSHG